MVVSSEHEANNSPWGSHWMAFTSSLWALIEAIGFGRPTWQMCTMPSVEQVANDVESRQSTSKHGAVCISKAARMVKVLASHTMAEWSTEPDSSMSPVLFHLSEKIGAVCLTRVALSCPLLSQIRARPSYEPVASVLPSGCNERKYQ